MEQMGRLGEFEAMVLATVIKVGDQANGVAIFEGLTAASGQTFSLPAVHVTLRRLEDKGLLTSTVGTSSDRGGRPRRFYQATPAGVRAVSEFREMWRRVWRGLSLPEAESTK